MKRRVLYSEANYAAIVRDHGYFVDKTAYVAPLEAIRIWQAPVGCELIITGLFM
ncbi:MAG: hypothetical protein ACOYNY_07105 [Caldilineaceae bacterium]